MRGADRRRFRQRRGAVPVACFDVRAGFQEALHELDADEFAELSQILRGLTVSLHQETGCVKEYVSCFSEAEGFAHIHVHVVPRAPDMPPDLRGPRVFGLLGVDDTANRDEVIRFCDRLRARMAEVMQAAREGSG